MKKIIIKAPVAKPKMIVWVHNYRSKRKDGQQIWEQGLVTSVKYDLCYKHWSYDVRLLRKPKNRNGWDYTIDLYVGDDGLSLKKPV